MEEAGDREGTSGDFYGDRDIVLLDVLGVAGMGVGNVDKQWLCSHNKRVC